MLPIAPLLEGHAMKAREPEPRRMPSAERGAGGVLVGWRLWRRAEFLG